MEKKQKVIYDSITGMTKEELTRFLAMVAPTIACRMCPYWDVSEERCFADRDFACTNEYASALIAKYLDCPVDGVDEEKSSSLEDCPFCGGKAKLRETTEEMPFSEERNVFVVRCEECGCAPFPVYYDMLYYNPDHQRIKAELQKKAEDAWNRRSGRGKSE